jgi:hypothetical protein
MNNKFSWQEFDRKRSQAIKEAAEREATEKRLHREGVAAGKRQRQEITEKIVRPFLQAMSGAGNPGSGLLRGRWTDGVVKPNMRRASWPHQMLYYEVYIGGSWLVGGTLNRDFVNVHTLETPPAWSCSSDFRKGESTCITDNQIAAFQGALVAILRRYKIPLPRD